MAVWAHISMFYTWIIQGEWLSYVLWCSYWALAKREKWEPMRKTFCGGIILAQLFHELSISPTVLLHVVAFGIRELQSTAMNYISDNWTFNDVLAYNSKKMKWILITTVAQRKIGICFHSACCVREIYSLYTPAAKSVPLSLNCMQNHTGFFFFFFPLHKIVQPFKVSISWFQGSQVILNSEFDVCRLRL